MADLFLAEALDHLGTIEAALLALDDRPGDVTLLNDIFRPFHTIKGNAGALGVTSVQEVAHRVENLLDLARSGRRTMGPADVDVVLRAVDVLTSMIRDVGVRLIGSAWSRPRTGRPGAHRSRGHAASRVRPRRTTKAPAATVERAGPHRGAQPTPAAALPRRGDEMAADQGRHAKARQPRGRGRRAHHRPVADSGRSAACQSRRPAAGRQPGSAEAHHRRSAAQRDGAAHGADPPGVPEGVAHRARPEPQGGQVRRARAQRRGHRARSQGRRGDHRSR